MSNIPIVIGITGHREIHDADGKLAEQLKRIIQSIKSQYEATEIVVLCSLAEGADRIAAKVAIGCEGVQLSVVLPLPKEEFEQDFLPQNSVLSTMEERADSINQFRDLLSRADSWFEVPVDNTIDNYIAGNKDTHGQRAERYRAVTEYIVIHSQFLIALWDGMPGEGPGSTAEAVSLIRHGTYKPGASRSSIKNPPHFGILYHIVTPRLNSGYDGADEAYSVKGPVYPDIHCEGEEISSVYKCIFAKIEDFNQDQNSIEYGNKPDTSTQYDDAICELYNEDIPTDLRQTALHLCHVDAIAKKYKTLHRQTILRLLAYALIGFGCLELFPSIPQDFKQGYLVLIGFPIGLLISWLALRRSKAYHTKFLSYRALAEGMRVQFYWQALGSRWNAADYYMDKHRGAMLWIRMAIDAWAIPRGKPASHRAYDQDLLPQAIQLVRDRWLIGQHEYFKKAMYALERASMSIDKWRMILFGTAVALSMFLIILLAVCSNNNFPMSSLTGIINVLILAIALTFVISGAFAHYTEIMTHSLEARHYLMAIRRFKTAIECVDRAVTGSDFELAMSLLQETGKEALWENADWVEYHEQRPPSLLQL